MDDRYPKFSLPSGGWTDDKERADRLWGRSAQVVPLALEVTVPEGTDPQDVAVGVNRAIDDSPEALSWEDWTAGAARVAEPRTSFETRRSADSAKSALELTCARCGQYVCDVEPGDSLSSLDSMADDHQCEEHLLARKLADQMNATYTENCPE